MSLPRFLKIKPKDQQCDFKMTHEVEAPGKSGNM